MSDFNLSARAFAPATVANVNVGFDLLGYALPHVGDIVEVEKTNEASVQIESVSGVGNIPLQAENNTAGKPLLELIKQKNLNFGFKVKIEKGIPLGSGMGGSAASAVGAVVAANALLESPLSLEEQFQFALEGEAVATGAKHADNVMPCLFGGLVLTTHLKPLAYFKLPLPELVGVSFSPKISIKTKEARAVLKEQIPLSLHTQQLAQLSGFICSLYENNFEQLKNHFSDFIVEPQRAKLIPGFAEFKKEALKCGALGCGISGSGPSVFAWVTTESLADQIIELGQSLLGGEQVEVNSWKYKISEQGARVL